MFDLIKSMINNFFGLIGFKNFKKEGSLFNNKPTVQLLNDPTTPRLRISKVIIPTNFLKFTVKGFNSTGNILLSESWQKENVYANINGALAYFKKYFPQNVNKWAAVNSLTVDTRAGNDANAYYDRKNLKFFYFNAKKKTIYTCDSADVVVHELGHAILDAIRPDFWSLASFEVGAFHESFGDITSLLACLSYDVCLKSVLKDTNNDLSKSNFISKLAEQFGVSLRMGSSLRNAVNNYNYVDPKTLPHNGDGLIQEIHSFAEVWTGTFYDLLIEFFNLHGKNYAALVKARDLSAEFLFNAIQNTPSNPNFFKALATNYISYDLTKYNSQYNSILIKVFTKRNLISASLSESLINNKFNIMSDGNNILFKEEKFVSLDAKEFDMNIDDFNVQIAADTYKPKNNVFNMLSIENNIDESLESAKLFVKYLKNKDSIGKNANQSWEIDSKTNSLTRKFSCYGDLGFINNCTIEGQPEFGKCWKSENNSGCCPYGCQTTKESPTPEKPVCSISYNSCNKSSYISCNGTVNSVCNCKTR